MFSPPTLPSLDLKPILELRARFERRTDRDFNRSNVDNASDLLSRFRGGASFKRGAVSGQLVYQYAHGEDWSRARNSSAWRSDLLLAFAGTKVGAGSLTLGRQRLSLGSERLFGIGEWNNVSNAWDGGRYAFGPFDLFAFKSGVNPFPDETVRIVGGAYTKGFHQVLLAFKHDGRSADTDVLTVSELYRRTVGRVRIDAEVAGQVGRRRGADVLAGAIDAIATVPVAPRLTFSVQGSVASGGRDGGTSRTFDPLFPSGHDKHGLIDVSGWSNLRDLGLWFRYEPDRATSVKLQYHGFGLDSARDAWYNPAGRVNGRFLDATGSRGRDLGDEFDVDFSRTLNPHQTVRAGLGVLLPGRFQRSFAGGSSQDEVWAYGQWAYRF